MDKNFESGDASRPGGSLDNGQNDTEHATYPNMSMIVNFPFWSVSGHIVFHVGFDFYTAAQVEALEVLPQLCTVRIIIPRLVLGIQTSTLLVLPGSGARGPAGQT